MGQLTRTDVDGLKRPLGLRLIATALALGASLVALYASFWALILGSVALSLLALGAAGGSALAVWPLLEKRWARGALVVVQGLAVAVVLGGYAAVALFSAEIVRDGLTERTVFAMPSADLAFWAALALIGVLAAVIVARALPVERTRRVRAAVTGVLAVATLFGAGVTVAIAAGGDPCDDFRFDRAAWRADDTRERVGRALVRCRALQGLRGEEVAALLGGRARQQGYTLDTGEDALGWPTVDSLAITYGDDGRVRTAALSHWRD